MTVSEVIEILKVFDQSLPVLIASDQFAGTANEIDGIATRSTRELSGGTHRFSSTDTLPQAVVIHNSNS